MRKVVIKKEEVKEENIEGFAEGFVIRNPISPKACGAKNMRIGYNIFPPKSGPAIHRHLGEEAWYVLKGEGFLRVEGEKHYFKKGDFMHIPSDVVHQTVNTSEDVFEYIFIVSPHLTYQKM